MILCPRGAHIMINVLWKILNNKISVRGGKTTFSMSISFKWNLSYRHISHLQQSCRPHIFSPWLLSFWFCSAWEAGSAHHLYDPDIRNFSAISKHRRKLNMKDNQTLNGKFHYYYFLNRPLRVSLYSTMCCPIVMTANIHGQHSSFRSWNLIKYLTWCPWMQTKQITEH